MWAFQGLAGGRAFGWRSGNQGKQRPNPKKRFLLIEEDDIVKFPTFKRR
jgi:hypothetical protein